MLICPTRATVYDFFNAKVRYVYLTLIIILLTRRNDSLFPKQLNILCESYQFLKLNNFVWS